MSEPSSAARSALKVFLFTDLEGSVELKRRIGDPDAARLIEAHDAVARRCAASHGCLEINDTGDGIVAVFDRPSEAIRCALAFQRGLAELEGPRPLRARAGIHLGETSTNRQADGSVKYVGLAIDTAARVMGLAQGGQILMTRAAFDSGRQHVAASPEGEDLEWLAHGPYRFKGTEQDPPTEIFEVGLPERSPLRVPPDGAKAWRVVAPEEEITLGWRPAAGLKIPGRTGWKLTRKLGEGGFGEVWLAEHDRTRQSRTFKFCFRAERLRTLKRELTLFRLLREVLGDRPDIARLYDVRLDAAPYYLELEYTPGGDLREWAERQGGIAQAPLPTRLAIVAQVAEALAAAHSVGVIHKDVKPTNVLIDEHKDGSIQARLTDFGIGQLMSREQLEAANITAVGLTTAAASPTELSSRTGTRLYMAPELLAGGPATIQSDIYALGVLLYQVVVGDLERPLAHGWERQVEDEIIRGDVAACVDGDRSRRLPGAPELADRLRNLETRRTARKAAEKARVAQAEARRRRRQMTALLAALAMVALASGLVALREARLRAEADAQRRRADERAEALEREQYVSMIRLVNQYLTAGEYGQAVRSLLSAPETLRNWEWGYLMAKAQPGLLALRGHEDIVRSAAFSPDGTRIVTASEDDTARVWDAATGAELLALRGHEAVVWSAAFSPDGTRIVTASEDKTARVWDATTGADLLALRGHEDSVRSAAFSPDGTRIVTASEDDTARVWDAATGAELLALRGHEAVVWSAAFSPDGSRIVTAGQDRTARIWETFPWQRDRELPWPQRLRRWQGERMARWWAGSPEIPQAPPLFTETFDTTTSLEGWKSRGEWALVKGGGVHAVPPERSQIATRFHVLEAPFVDLVDYAVSVHVDLRAGSEHFVFLLRIDALGTGFKAIGLIWDRGTFYWSRTPMDQGRWGTPLGWKPISRRPEDLSVVRLYLEARGNTFRAYANEVFLGEFQAEGFERGSFGPAYWLYRAPDPPAVFRNLRVWGLEEAP